ncbi:hypothetical protein TVAG_076570 [Trichomonas vaginalis G3]|uniref:Uncharacterized protein n=1 Tax=Trichomonas vaginalis (strain ATCC PRA-98 / G3) TaxID=412133 RepID=A2D9Q4_TRIV3|nr:hypothetical protein TVAGG3_0292240 [Trichomonas vaginalis G3]EAY22910.1 hypothetical protein TVAG_076570 [Trichomonas vaginalis G3]KAI5527364.1 hypothetical protein TVAGG3_0292240 [Trichomonas vaginalis G3]|eukprot:XP_001583896.1 hypothetical protein [Trichomonas vaginalis G3]
MTCPQCEPDPVKSEINLSDSSDDSDYKNDLWEDKIIIINPGQEWESPDGKAVFLTQVSMTISPTNSANDVGILTATTQEGKFTISKLFPHQPTSSLNLTFSKLQAFHLSNSGNRPLSVALLVKC